MAAGTSLVAAAFWLPLLPVFAISRWPRQIEFSCAFALVGALLVIPPGPLHLAARWCRRASARPRSARVAAELGRAALLTLPLLPWCAAAGLALSGLLPRVSQPLLAVPLELATAGSLVLPTYGLVLAFRLARPPAPSPAGSGP